MPVILRSEAQEAWLSKDAEREGLKRLLAPFPASEMKSYPVGTQVNRTQVDDAQLVQPMDLGPDIQNGMLF